MKKLIECVPNFSEGCDMSVIKQITDAIESVEGISLLDVDPGQATNRTVVTFVGEPEPVMEAAICGIRKASELIDMRKHSGAHPRFGATDVCPLVPVKGITMEETVEYARKLAKRVGEELGIPVYCYEHAAYTEERKNLANCRAGEYEALSDRITTDEWKPDYGPAEFTDSVAKTGVTAVGARDFLVAFNVNLNTTSTRRANAMAFDVREKGRKKRKGNPLTGPFVKDENGKQVWIPGTLKAVKGIGWFIEEYGIAQISMNLTNINVTSVHEAFDEVCKKATERGLRVTGSELVGLMPLEAMLDAGRYFLRKQNRSLGVSDKELINIAVKSMGLDDLYEFKPEDKIIEYAMQKQDDTKKLVDMNLSDFMWETASESPAPGGGSIAAYMGALGAALGTMVANLSSHKRGWDERWEEFSQWAEKGKKYHDELLHLVDEDTHAFNKIMDAFGLPKKTEEEKVARKKAINDATRYAIEVPLKTMKVCYESMEVMKAMADIGNPNSVSDAAVGAIAAVAGVRGAHLNVRINTGGFEDKSFVAKILKEAADIEDKAIKLEKEIMDITEPKL
ncbi:MAG: glutamate formimidoyltransferase [Candidatus Delongbacteria bacterium]|jgi:glutamate formiminotransferase/formiminotetrahydrofolate cyclodeaminase|nr:glutamate formimidoyltransferase [Candidatus Delongbacteria bacterium]